MKKISAGLIILAVALLLLALWQFYIESYRFAAPALFSFFVLSAVAVRSHEAVKGFAYTFWIGAAVTISMYYPAPFVELSGFQLKELIVPLLQVIMFGVGTAMSLQDFKAVLTMPRGVFVGMACQFTIMPLIGLMITRAFDFPPEIAAGIILVGSSPSGLASNVMSYISRANLALSVTMTAVATLMAPIVTPFLMEMLAGQYIPIDFWAMVWSIIKIVIIPIAAGLIFNRLAHGRFPWLDKAMPVVSMIAIGVIITIITAAGRDSLLSIGLLLIAACLIHNMAGYSIGYGVAKLLRFDEKSCRTIALEVGMQNSGLASGIALQMGKVATVGLAAAVFGPLMNITGSSLASWWRRRT